MPALTVMVTRPHPQGEILCQQLETAGFKSICFPTIAFEATKMTQDLAYEAISAATWLIFTSPQAVSFALPWFLHRLVSSSTRYAAVGPGTAQALAAAGYHATYPPDGVGSEALLALSSFAHVQGQKIVLVKGQFGSTQLKETLTQRGAFVSEWILYKRSLPTLAVSDYQSFFEQKIDAIICTSFEGVRNLKWLVSSLPSAPTHWTILQTIPLIVVSARIKKLAHDLGFQRIWVAQNASYTALLQALMELSEEIS